MFIKSTADPGPPEAPRPPFPGTESTADPTAADPRRPPDPDAADPVSAAGTRQDPPCRRRTAAAAGSGAGFIGIVWRRGRGLRSGASWFLPGRIRFRHLGIGAVIPADIAVIHGHPPSAGTFPHPEQPGQLQCPFHLILPLRFQIGPQCEQKLTGVAVLGLSQLPEDRQEGGDGLGIQIT